MGWGRRGGVIYVDHRHLKRAVNGREINTHTQAYVSLIERSTENVDTHTHITMYTTMDINLELTSHSERFTLLPIILQTDTEFSYQALSTELSPFWSESGNLGRLFKELV